MLHSCQQIHHHRFMTAAAANINPGFMWTTMYQFRRGPTRGPPPSRRLHLDPSSCLPLGPLQGIPLLGPPVTSLCSTTKGPPFPRSGLVISPGLDSMPILACHPVN
ncbi:hypothetical protein M406DRAFT_103060 [Cryphonectria parasitica EP155]|uniref:Uncharacterized protein n=1 Tax=Cryphonectria parasitica (strain ATCC 38755 / EP155) TaxID=660469 RepID=A0A9P4XWH7_CRYP1|nr:uncharacterized protein M406DRAFT_103060 [Cryphonectria parasitica EP155]KAF3762188.1 hypothetical protein M406DRAFT_103060 [Cryphonectria parasitica EP155]